MTNEITTRFTGRVKWFNHNRGYGFITLLTGDKKDHDIFVHHTNLSTKENVYRSLTQGEYVELCLEIDEKNKDFAKNVTGILGGQLLCEVSKFNKEDRTGREA